MSQKEQWGTRIPKELAREIDEWRQGYGLNKSQALEQLARERLQQRRQILEDVLKNTTSVTAALAIAFALGAGTGIVPFTQGLVTAGLLLVVAAVLLLTLTIVLPQLSQFNA